MDNNLYLTNKNDVILLLPNNQKRKIGSIRNDNTFYCVRSSTLHKVHINDSYAFNYELIYDEERFHFTRAVITLEDEKLFISREDIKKLGSVNQAVGFEQQIFVKESYFERCPRNEYFSN